MYFLNYLDRNALPQARLNTLEKDLNLKGVQYNTAISILFVGYLLMQSMLHRPNSMVIDPSSDKSSPLEHVHDANPTIYLPVLLHDWLGRSISQYRRRYKLLRPDSLSILLGFC